MTDRYKLQTERSKMFYSVDEFMQLKWLQVPLELPKHPRFPSGEWYCNNQECEVREVDINLKYVEVEKPHINLKMHCPLCGAQLTFHNYHETVTLEPETFKDEEDSVPDDLPV